MIPAYQAERFVGAALDSVAAQTRLPERIVVVDDGSTDRTADRVRSWAAEAEVPTTLLRQENRGPSAARNAGILRAEEALIALLDADDELRPHHLATLAPTFVERPDVVVCFGNAERRGTEGGAGRRYFSGTPLEDLPYRPLPSGLRLLEKDVFSTLIHGSYIPSCGVVFRRSAARRAGHWDPSLPTANDRDFWLRMSRQGRFAYTPRVVARVRYHGGNITHRRNAARLMADRLRVVQKMLDMSDELALSGAEILEARRARYRHAEGLAYHASLGGVSGLLRAAPSLLRARAIGPRRLARHAARSVVHSLPGAGGSGGDRVPRSGS